MNEQLNDIELTEKLKLAIEKSEYILIKIRIN